MKSVAWLQFNICEKCLAPIQIIMLEFFSYVGGNNGMAPCQFNALLLFVSSSDFYLMIGCFYLCKFFYWNVTHTYFDGIFFAQFYICTKVSMRKNIAYTYYLYCVCLRVADC